MKNVYKIFFNGFKILKFLVLADIKGCKYIYYFICQVILNYNFLCVQLFQTRIYNLNKIRTSIPPNIIFIFERIVTLYFQFSVIKIYKNIGIIALNV